jgi:hypothetical protein
MASGALFIRNAISKHVMVADGTVFLYTDMQFVVKLNPIVKLRQGVYSHRRWSLTTSAENRSSEKKQRHDHPFQNPSLSTFHSFAPPHIYGHTIYPGSRHPYCI